MSLPQFSPSLSVSLPQPSLPQATPSRIRRLSPTARSGVATPSVGTTEVPVSPRITPIRTASPTARTISPIRRSSPVSAGAPAVVASPSVGTTAGVSPRITPIRRSSPVSGVDTTAGVPLSPRITPIRRSSPVAKEPSFDDDLPVSPRRISPRRIASPLDVGTTSRKEETMSPKRIAPIRRASPMSPGSPSSFARGGRTSPLRGSAQARKFYHPNARMLENIYRGELVGSGILSASAIAAAAIVAGSGMVEKYATEYAEHYSKDQFWRRVFAMRYPRVFAMTFGDLPTDVVKGLDSKEGRPLKTWREYFLLMSGNLYQDEAEVMISSCHTFRRSVLWQYILPFGEIQDELVLDTVNDGGKWKNIITYYYTPDSKIKSIRELFSIQGSKFTTNGFTMTLL